MSAEPTATMPMAPTLPSAAPSAAMPAAMSATTMVMFFFVKMHIRVFR
jgi:hypothetical protein